MKQPVNVYLDLLIQPFLLYRYPSVECLCWSNGSDGLERVFVTFHQDSSVRSENVLEEKCQIKTLVDLKWWIDDYCAAMKKRAPTSPQIKVILDAEPKALEGQLASLFHAHILHIIHSGFFSSILLWCPHIQPHVQLTARHCGTHKLFARRTSAGLGGALPQRLLRRWEIKLGHCTKTFTTGWGGWGHSIDPQAQGPDSGIAARSWCHLQGTDGWCGHEARNWKKEGTPGQAQAAERSSKADVAKQNFCPPSSCSSNWQQQLLQFWLCPIHWLTQKKT